MSSKIGNWVSSQKGLTLTELMVAISIVAILAMVGVASFSNSLPRYRLNATARDLLSDMRMARQLAATENRQYAVQFLTTTSYKVVHGNQPLIQSSTSFPAYTGKDNVKANTGVSWTMPAMMPLFQPNGLISRWDPSSNIVSAGAPDAIVLTNNAVPVDTKTVVIGTSGRIRIQ
jgi:prepilin-type N-terminal cleavage/methylation domain-containing protein